MFKRLTDRRIADLQRELRFERERYRTTDHSCAVLCAALATREREVRLMHRALARKSRVIRYLRSLPKYLNEKSAYSAGYKAGYAHGLRDVEVRVTVLHPDDNKANLDALRGTEAVGSNL